MCQYLTALRSLPNITYKPQVKTRYCRTVPRARPFPNVEPGHIGHQEVKSYVKCAKSSRSSHCPHLSVSPESTPVHKGCGERPLENSMGYMLYSISFLLLILATGLYPLRRFVIVTDMNSSLPWPQSMDSPYPNPWLRIQSITFLLFERHRDRSHLRRF